MRKEALVIYCDFETTTKNGDENKSGVWLWGALVTKDEYYMGLDLGSFFDYVDSLRDNATLYFHNGSRFDFEFIKHYLGAYRIYVNEKNNMSLQSAYVMAKDANMTYSIIYRNAKGKTIYFKCSYLFLRTALENLPGSSKIKKPPEFYDKVRHYNDIIELHQEDREYMYHDLLSMKSAMDGYNEINKVGVNTFTCSSVAGKNFKKSIVDFNAKYKNKITVEQGDHFHNGSTGAMCQLVKKYQMKKIKDVASYDVNSLYPYIMTSSWIPYGEPLYENCGFECPHKFSLIKVRISGLIKGDYIPCLTTSNLSASYTIAAIEGESKFENAELYLTKSMGMECRQYYTGSNVELLECICFETTYGIGADFIEQQNAIKMASPSGSPERDAAKGNMNHCYGRLMMSPHNEKGFMVRITPSTPPLKHHQTRYGEFYMDYVDELEDEDKLMYLPAGIAILSNAREYLIKHIQLNRQHFVYCDTDSLKLANNPKFIGVVNPTALGAFKFEGVSPYGVYIKPKMYVSADKKEIIYDAKGAGIKALETFKGRTLNDVLTGNVDIISEGMIKVAGGKYMNRKAKFIKGLSDLKGGE